MDPNQDNIQLISGNIDIHCHTSPAVGMSIASIDTLDFQIGSKVGGYYSLGLHPWFIARQDIQQGVDKITLALADPNLLAIGECGLDKMIVTPLDEQIDCFQQQIHLAEYAHKPLIIHCVRAFNELMQLKKNSLAGIPWIIHGFNSKPTIAELLLKQGCYLSMGKALLNPQSNAAQTLSKMPLQQLFLETDAVEDISINAIYLAAAKIAGIHIDDLQQQIIRNFQRVFLHD